MIPGPWVTFSWGRFVTHWSNRQSRHSSSTWSGRTLKIIVATLLHVHYSFD